MNSEEKSPLPISAADVRTVLAALRVSAFLNTDTCDLAYLARAAGGALRDLGLGSRPL
jgi:hypothetical protein